MGRQIFAEKKKNFLFRITSKNEILGQINGYKKCFSIIKDPSLNFFFQ